MTIPTPQNKAAHVFTFESDSCGYMIKCDGKPIGGARSLGTATHTRGGMVRHWKHRQADRKMHFETAQRTCLDLAAGRGPEYLRRNI